MNKNIMEFAIKIIKRILESFDPFIDIDNEEALRSSSYSEVAACKTALYHTPHF